MKQIVSVVIVVLMVVVAIGMLVPTILRDRAAADRARCMEHMRRLAVQGIGDAVKSTNAFPAGTVVVPALEPERRLNWIAPLLLTLGRDDLRQKLDMTVPWDAPPNQAVAQTQFVITICPAAAPANAPPGFSPLCYVGNGGVGPQAATLAADQPGAGIFRYDAPTPVAAVKDGISNCMLLLETADRPGPWLAGGPASVRSLDPAAEIYIGKGFAFGGNHPNGANIAFADGSVRFIDATIQPGIFRQIAAIADGSQ